MIRKTGLYYEFLDFYRVSLNCDVWFSKEGSYQKLLEQMGMEPDQVWTEEERLFFRSSYGRFAKATAWPTESSCSLQRETHF